MTSSSTGRISDTSGKRSAKAARIEWSVLDWNKPSIEFYEELGARRHDGWYMYRLENAALKKLGGG